MRTIESTPARYVDSDDPRAVLRAWGGEDVQRCTLDMGGWTDGDADAFRAAVQVESVRQAGAPLGCVQIVETAPVVTDDTVEALDRSAPTCSLWRGRPAFDFAVVRWMILSSAPRRFGHRRGGALASCAPGRASFRGRTPGSTMSEEQREANAEDLRSAMALHGVPVICFVEDDVDRVHDHALRCCRLMRRLEQAADQGILGDKDTNHPVSQFWPSPIRAHFLVGFLANTFHKATEVWSRDRKRESDGALVKHESPDYRFAEVVREVQGTSLHEGTMAEVQELLNELHRSLPSDSDRFARQTFGWWNDLDPSSVGRCVDLSRAGRDTDNRDADCWRRVIGRLKTELRLLRRLQRDAVAPGGPTPEHNGSGRESEPPDGQAVGSDVGAGPVDAGPTVPRPPGCPEGYERVVDLCKKFGVVRSVVQRWEDKLGRPRWKDKDRHHVWLPAKEFEEKARGRRPR